MANPRSKPSLPRIVLSASRDIPFDKLVLSQANVRRIKAGVSIEDLAEDIAARTLLQGLSVRPVRDADGNETGLFEVPAGGRRFRALELLIKQKRLARTAPIPCVVRTEGLAIEDSLAENIQRAPLHPLDQFRAFVALRDSGLGEEEIAARFFITPAVVRQRLRLAAVSPKLLDLYGDDQMTLEQLMAFTIVADPARQEQVWENLATAYNKEPFYIRKLLTEGAVRATDKRARFVGIAAYEAAGGVVQRDLFQSDDGGWLHDIAVLDRLVAERLEAEAANLQAEGWKWVEAAADFPYGHTAGLRRLIGEPAALSEEEQAGLAALHAEYAQLEESHAEADELPEEIDRRLGEIEAAIEAFETRPMAYDPAEIARAGAFLSIDPAGTPRIERGFVRLEDEAPMEPEPEAGIEADPVDAPAATSGGEPVDDEDDAAKPLPDRLVIELTAHRTLALRDALARDPDTAVLAVLHVLCLKLFHHHTSDSSLEIEARSATFAAQAPGLADSPSARAIDARHQSWEKQLPDEPAELWRVLAGFDHDSRMALLAHCAALTVNAVREPWNRRAGALVHADHLARAVGLDMAAAGWVPTVDTYLGRVTKARILEAVREAKGETAARMIDHLRKPDMAREAEQVLDGAGWLPEPLRRPAEADSSDLAAE
ncbi:ParB/RepB/Spo0J family partition protein [Magnetospirillum sp. 15-1]|uniref:ParB/RepB/Spo0J family partition protein n=1 Tax=Magnetospirillum sp. 15-1 TaxID=1979370 RepID=UPI000BBC96A0|nr:ParB/RepB/Spo0J family partition protein [Magnetospirillum sp. 15-1]